MSYEDGFKSDSTKMSVVINDRSLRLIRRGQRIARIGEMIMMSHVSVSQLGCAGLCWAVLGWAAGGLLVGNPINHDTEEQREV